MMNDKQILFLNYMKDNLLKINQWAAEGHDTLNPHLKKNNEPVYFFRQITKRTAASIYDIDQRIEALQQEIKPEEPKFITKQMIENNLYVKEFPKRICPITGKEIE